MKVILTITLLLSTIISSNAQIIYTDSIDQNIDVKVLEQTEEYTKYQNLFFAYLALSFSIRTNEKVEFNPSTASYYYDLIIPKSNDILEIRKYLKGEYGIEMVEKREKVKIKTAIFN